MRKRNTMPTGNDTKVTGVLGPVLGAANGLQETVTANQPKPVLEETPEAARPQVIASNEPNLDQPAEDKKSLKAVDGGKAEEGRAARSKKSASEPPTPPRERRAFYLTSEVIEEARGCAEWSMTKPEIRMSLNELVEQAIRRELKRLAKTHNDGKPFNAPDRQLPVGRRVGR